MDAASIRGTKLLDTGDAVGQPTIAGLPGTSHLDNILNGVDRESHVPILMLPLRLETKYLGNDLWIRIFPDDIFIQSHEEGLTTRERDSGVLYWTSHYSSGGLRSAELDAWRILCEAHGTYRSLYIRKATTPTIVEIEETPFASLQRQVMALDETLMISTVTYREAVEAEALLNELLTGVSAALQSSEAGGYALPADVRQLWILLDLFEEHLRAEYDRRINPIARDVIDIAKTGVFDPLTKLVFKEDRSKIYYNENLLGLGAEPFTLDNRGNQVILADGDHALDDGSILNVSRGRVTARTHTGEERGDIRSFVETNDGIVLAFDGYDLRQGSSVNLRTESGEEETESLNGVYTLQNGTQVTLTDGEAVVVVHPVVERGRELPHLEPIFTSITDELRSLDQNATAFNDSRPNDPITPNLTFPDASLTHQDHAWMTQAFSDALPKRFVAVGYKDINISVGGSDTEVAFVQAADFDVREGIKLGIKPGSIETEEGGAGSFMISANGEDIEVEEALQWMIDKDLALADGMAIKVPAADDEYTRIVVLGLSDSDLSTSKQTLTDIFEDHAYTKGLALMSTGNPTNNTEGDTTDFSPFNDDHEKWFETFSPDTVLDLDRTTDFERFWRGLGIEKGGLDSMLHKDRTTITDGMRISKVIFPGTGGMFMEDMLDNILNDDNRERIKTFFEKYVSGRGALPSFRIGEQPYGIQLASRLHGFEIKDENKVLDVGGEYEFEALNQTQGLVVEKNVPETPNSNYQNTFYELDPSVVSNAVWQKRFDVRMKEFLKFLDIEWRRTAQDLAKNVYLPNLDYHQQKAIDAGEPDDWDASEQWDVSAVWNPQSHFMDILGLHPHSLTMYARYMVNSGSFIHLRNHPPQDPVGGGSNFVAASDAWFNNLHTAGYEKLSKLLTGLEGGNSVQDPFSKGFYFYRPDLKSEPMLPSDMVAPDLYDDFIKSSRNFRVTPTKDFVRFFANELSDAAEIPLGSPEHYTAYIDWLNVARPWEIYAQNNFDELPSRSMLFLLLRTAILAKYRDVGTKLFVAEGITDWNSLMNLGSPEEAMNSGIAINTQDPLGFNGEAANFWNNDTPWFNYDEQGPQYYANAHVLGWQMTRWNLLLEPIYGEQITHINGGDCSPSSYSQGWDWWARQSFWKFFGYDSQAVDFAINDLDDDDDELTYNIIDFGDAAYYHSRVIYDQHPLIRYLRGDYTEPGFQEDTFLTVVERDIDYPLRGVEDLPIRSLGDYLHSPDGTGIDSTKHAKFLNELSDYRVDLDRLKDFSLADLEKGVHETIDLTSYRLDAWINGIYAQRLDYLRTPEVIRDNEEHVEARGSERQTLTNGSYLGAFGYVENLKKHNLEDIGSSNRELVPSAEIPSEFSSYADDLYRDNSWDGYVITPSVTHAITAAILRSGYLTSRALEQSAVHDQLSIRLSSKRVRAAMKLLNGVRDGQDLSELLGYMFEKGLHERSATDTSVELDKYIHGLRKRFPTSLLEETVTPFEELRSGVVLDGLALAEHILELTSSVDTFGVNNDSFDANDSLFDFFSQQDNRISFDLLNLSNEIPEVTDEANYLAFLFELDQMISSFDSLSDLVVSEGVFQVAGGNMERANAVLSMMSGGRNISAPEVIETPKSEYRFENRVLLNFPIIDQPESGRAAHWEGIPLGPMSKLEPSLNKWVGEKMGDSQRLVCDVRYRADADQPWTGPVQITIAELGTQALDLLMTFGKDPLHIESMLGAKIKHRTKVRFGLSYDAEVSVDFEQTIASAGQISMFEFMPYLESIRGLIQKSEPLSAKDLEHQTDSAVDDKMAFDLPQVLARITAVQADFESLLLECGFALDANTSEPFLENVSTKTPQQLIDLLTALSSYGFVGAVPASGSPQDDEVDVQGSFQFDPDLRFKMEEDILAHCSVLDFRLSRVNEILAGIDPETAVNKVWGQYQKVARAMFGFKFPIIPQCTVRNESELATAVNEPNLTSLFRDEDRTDKVSTWFHSLFRVRKNLGDLETYSFFSEIFASAEEFTPAQIPYATDDYWLGCDFPSDVKFIGRSNILLSDSSLIGERMCGLKIDDWTEGIPKERISGAVAYHMDQPGAEAPQALLLALPARADGTWTADDLLYSVLETFDMAKYRTLEPEELMTNDLIAKLCPANASDSFPITTDTLDPNGDYDFPDGIRPSFDYFKNLN